VITAPYSDSPDFTPSARSARRLSERRISADTSTGLFTPAAVRMRSIPPASTKS
jgi:hypothetical protein